MFITYLEYNITLLILHTSGWYFNGEHIFDAILFWQYFSGLEIASEYPALIYLVFRWIWISGIRYSDRYCGLFFTGRSDCEAAGPKYAGVLPDDNFQRGIHFP